MAGDTSMSREAVIDGLSQAEISPWIGNVIRREAYRQEITRLNDNTHGIFVFQVRDGEVILLPKPSAFHFDMLQSRAEIYLSFFASVLSEMPTGRDFLVAVETGDQPLNVPFPTLSFQKLVGDRTILINDVNILEADFYQNAPFVDGRAYGDKLDKAVFVGSTSGITNTMATLEAGANPRIESAKAFRDDPRVDFWLPNVVQADEATAAAIRAMGFGDRIVGWDEQFGYKLLLSLDGNGATCQRLAVSLKSNSAVVKYDSASVLYYFPAMVPWVHYVPVASDLDVVNLFVDGVDERCAEIAANGRQFFDAILGREPSRAYAAKILAGFGRLFDA